MMGSIRTTASSLLTGALVAALTGSPLMAQEAAKPAAPAAPAGPAKPNQLTGNEINDRQKASVEKGLAWLAKRQGENGTFTAGQGGGYGNNVAITSLGGLAFMQAGNLPGRGKYGKEVQKCLEAVLSACQRNGLIVSESTSGPMYGHGFATLFLGEVYGMTGNEEVKEKLQRAVQLIQKTQNAEGGWRYQPVPYDADISVTITQIMGLRAARDAGIKVEKEVIDKAVQYVRNCQNADGGFNYMANMSNGSGFPRSAAGVASLFYAGISEGDNVDRGLKYLRTFTPGKGARDNEGHYFYGHYYAVQAMFLAGGENWANWYPAIRDELISKQGASGSWSIDMTEDYGTAMALIILQMPNRYLPVYAGKGPGS